MILFNVCHFMCKQFRFNQAVLVVIPVQVNVAHKSMRQYLGIKQY
jgi:hypothetical protein